MDKLTKYNVGTVRKEFRAIDRQMDGTSVYPGLVFGHIRPTRSSFSHHIPVQT